jgi:ribosome biogenesis protein BMS1
LPFASKPKVQKKKNRDSYVAKRAVVLEPEDRKKRATVQILETIRTDKVCDLLKIA